MRALQSVAMPAHRIAPLFTESDMRILSAVYDRLSWYELSAIDVTAADLGIELEDSDGTFGQYLGSRLISLALVEADTYFALPGSVQAEASTQAINLAERVRRLGAEESVALHVVLEAVQTVPCAVFGTGNWWYPAMLLRLLRQPEFDRP